MTHRPMLTLMAVAFAVSSAIGCQTPTENAATPAQETAAPAPTAPAPSVASALWTVTEEMATPESTFVDTESDSIFVSLINGEPDARDGNGYIARLSRDGKVVNIKWATGLNAPKGLRKHGGTLWASDLDEVVGIDIASGKITSRVKVDGAKFLNDLATGPDGTLYVSDSSAYRIYIVKGGKASVFAEGEVVEAPNGVLVDGNRLVVGSLQQAPGVSGSQGRLFALDLKTKEKTVLSSEPVGTIDGVESDGSGGYIVTDVLAGKIVHVSASGAVRLLKQVEGTAADIGYDAGRKTVIVPHLRENKVAAYDISDVLK